MSVGAGEAVAVGVGSGVGEGVGVGIGRLGVGIGVKLGVGIGVKLGVGDGEGDGFGDGEGEGVGEGFGDGEGEGDGCLWLLPRAIEAAAPAGVADQAASRMPSVARHAVKADAAASRAHNWDTPSLPGLQGKDTHSGLKRTERPVLVAALP